MRTSLYVLSPGPAGPPTSAPRRSCGFGSRELKAGQSQGAGRAGQEAAEWCSNLGLVASKAVTKERPLRPRLQAAARRGRSATGLEDGGLLEGAATQECKLDAPVVHLQLGKGNGGGTDGARRQLRCAQQRQERGVVGVAQRAPLREGGQGGTACGWIRAMPRERPKRQRAVGLETPQVRQRGRLYRCSSGPGHTQRSAFSILTTGLFWPFSQFRYIMPPGVRWMPHAAAGGQGGGRKEGLLRGGAPSGRALLLHDYTSSGRSGSGAAGAGRVSGTHSCR